MIDLKTRNKIAQLIIDMEVGDKKPVRRQEMVPIIKEVNDTVIIGHAVMLYTNSEGIVTHIKKYRPTALEKRINSYDNEEMH
jgi:hypothetical protein